MSTNGLEVFDKTVQISNTWLKEIMEQHGPDRQQAWHILGAVLRAIRDRLPAELAAHLGSQLPLLVRGTYYDQYEPSRQPERVRSQDEFLARIQSELAFSRPVNGQDVVATVFHVLDHHIDPGQARKVREALPEHIRAMWPEPGPLH